MIFAWDDLNRDHIAKHGVSETEAEECVEEAKPPFPRALRDGKFFIWHQIKSGRYLQIVLVFKAPEEIEFASLTLDQWTHVQEAPGARVVRIIHAMEMTDRMKRTFRRQSR